MEFKIETYIPLLMKICNKDLDCEDTVSDFVLKVLEKGEGFITFEAKSEDEYVKWIKTCFKNFQTDIYRYNERRKNIRNPFLIENVNQKADEDCQMLQPDSDSSLFLKHIKEHFSDENYVLYTKLNEEEKKLFHVHFLSNMSFRDIARHRSENVYEVKLSIQRLKKRLKLLNK